MKFLSAISGGGIILFVVFCLIYGNARAQSVSKAGSVRLALEGTLMFVGVVVGLLVGASLIVLAVE